MLKYLLIFTVFFLTACGGGSGGASSAPAAYKQLSLSSTGTTVSYNEPSSFDLSITGTNNTITIQKLNTIHVLNISGSNNIITFSGSNIVTTFNISGSDNTFYVSKLLGNSVSFTNNTGAGNSIIYQ